MISPRRSEFLPKSTELELGAFTPEPCVKFKEVSDVIDLRHSRKLFDVILLSHVLLDQLTPSFGRIYNQLLHILELIRVIHDTWLIETNGTDGHQLLMERAPSSPPSW